MPDYEKLGAFYLGKVFDLPSKKAQQEFVLYDAKDLTTHALCVGMTGSGKTGLCLTLLEEAAIDGIPAIVIDPKGDLGNLLLTFPELRGSDFRPWVDNAEATRRGQSADEFAAATAKLWKDGLTAWDQDGGRIERFRSSADIALYTPGSTAGLPLTILRSFNAPAPAILQNAEALRERVNAATAGLLALLGIDADPIRSREQILVANLLDKAWREGRNLSLGDLIRDIQNPPLARIGIMDLESFYPSKDRFDLAMSLNNLLASPGFSVWMQGEPLDIQRLLYTAEGKPRISILSIAHLSDAERMFFVTLLLTEVIGWMRQQSGTSSLRALLYMDEVFGYFPPTANPPSKTPMLTLLKQARAFGLGVVLATQNPVDLDYKGLSNCGTWFLGRLQTERDKARVLDGLEGASTAAGRSFDRAQIDSILSGLSSRVFVMNNVHDDQPAIFQTRWTLSYLRGPLSREQIQSLMASRKATLPAEADPAAITASAATLGGSRPLLPPGTAEFFEPRRGSPPKGTKLAYRPSLFGSARVHFTQTSAAVDVWEELRFVVPLGEQLAAEPWPDAEVSNEDPEMEKLPEEGAVFALLPGDASNAKRLASLTTQLKDQIYRTHKLTLFKSAALRQTSKPGESESEFRARLSQSTREQRDLQVEKLRARYAPKLAALQEQIRKAAQRKDKEQDQAQTSTFNAAITIGAGVLGALFGRKLASATNISHAASSVRAASRIAKERGDVSYANENLGALQQRCADLEAEFQAETEKLTDSVSPDSLPLETISLAPKKTDIAVKDVAIYWTVWAVDEGGTATSLA